MRNSYVLISKPNEKLLFDDIFRDCQNNGKYSKTIIDAVEMLNQTGKTQFWSGSGNQFLYMVLGYLGVNIVCDKKCYSYNNYKKLWNIAEQTKPVKSISVKNLKSLNINNRIYDFNIVSYFDLSDKRYEINNRTMGLCPVGLYIKNREKRNKKKDNIKSIVKYINKKTKSNIKNDVVR